MSHRYAPPHGTAPGLAPLAEALASPDFQYALDEALRLALDDLARGKRGRMRPPLIRTGTLCGWGRP